MQRVAVQCNVLQCNATCCSAMQRDVCHAICDSAIQCVSTFVAGCSILLQFAAGCCKVLLGGAVCLNVINVCDMMMIQSMVLCGVVQCVSTCVAVCCCSVLLQCVVAHGAEWCSMSQCHQCVRKKITTQSVLQCVAGWCSVSQPVLQYVVAHGAEWSQCIYCSRCVCDRDTSTFSMCV